jgi:NAD(P)-dependent dehydrogenase (short-subunit alcohol dehydrogenase family)
MRLAGAGAIVSGGASGLGAATARALVERGARVAILDRDSGRAAGVAADLEAEHPGAAASYEADVTDERQLGAAIDEAVQVLGGIRFAVSCAGVGWAEKVVGRDGPAQLRPFETVLQVNLVGTFNVLRLTAAAMARNDPDAAGERGAIVMTASIAAFDGQMGQTAYSASKGGVVGLTLPAARDLARIGVRVCTIAPGLFDTPLLAALPEEARAALAETVPFPARLGDPAEFAALACHIAENPMLNGETIRLDGALRMAPR